MWTPSFETLNDSIRPWLSLSVGSCNVLGPLQLHFQTLHPNLETVHRLNKIRYSKTGETIIIMMRRVINIILITWMIKDHCHDHHNFKLLPKIGDDHDDHLDCSLSAALVVEADEAKAFALVCSSVNEHLMIVKIIIMVIMVVMSLTKTLELMTFPNGKNICISSASPNSWENTKLSLNHQTLVKI